MSLPVHLFNGKPYGAEQLAQASDESFEASFPCIHALLTFPTVAGEMRETSKLTVGTQGGMFFARLIDDDNKRSITLTGPSFFGAMQALEDCLQSPNPPAWFYWQQRGARRGKKSESSSGQSTGFTT